MQKSAAALISLFIFALFLSLAGQTAAQQSSSPGVAVLTSDYKSAPEETALADVRRQIIASYKPTPDRSPALLDRSPDTKKKAVQFSRVSDSSFRRKLSARSAIVIDARTGEEIYSHNPDRPGQPASTIKILTSLIAIDSLKNNALVPVSGWAANMPRSKIYLRKGKSYYADDLINAVLLASANDASVALAEKIAGSESGFARIMTSKANELGARKTICKTASGLTAKGQQTTARDLAMIFREAMNNPEFADRVKRVKAKTSYGKTLRNHNKALWQITGAQGGKTGYTWAAKQTYVGKFSRDGEEILVAILGSRNMWNDIARLVEYGFDKRHQLQVAKHEDTGTAPDQASSFDTAMVVLTDSKKKEKL